MITIIFAILAGISNAIMDVLQFHYKTSIFTKYNPQWWNPEISWKNKYVDGKQINGLRTISILFVTIKYPVQITDAWHLFKTLNIISWCLAIVFYDGIINNYLNIEFDVLILDVIIIGTLRNLSFNLFYNKILRINVN